MDKYISLKDCLKELNKDEYSLPIILGKDSNNDIHIKDLVDLKNILIGGMTRSGKSVLLNSIISTILLTKTPKEVQLILIDFKQAEFQIYENIPHLIFPIITERKKLSQVSPFLSQEYLKRMRILRGDDKCRTIEDYNNRYGEGNKFPYIIVIVDEFSDVIKQFDLSRYNSLISGIGGEVGIYTILATSICSDTVITEEIRKSRHIRIAGMLTEKDSCFFLKEKSAEKLKGNGDMIYKDFENKEKIRIQIPWISTEEQNEIVKKAINEYSVTEYLPPQNILEWFTKEELVEKFGEDQVKIVDDIKLYPILTSKNYIRSHFLTELIWGILKSYETTPRDVNILEQKYGVNIKEQEKHYIKYLLKYIKKPQSGYSKKEFFLEIEIYGALQNLKDITSLEYAIPYYRNSVKLFPTPDVISNYIMAEIEYLYDHPKERTEEMYKNLRELFKKVKKEDRTDYDWNYLVLINYCLADLLEDENAKKESIKLITNEREKKLIKEESSFDILFGEEFF